MNKTLTINDNLKICRDVSANGVHLGQEDEQPQVAREYLGSTFHIGGTAHSKGEIDDLIASKAVDYIGIGPFRLTSTKPSLASPLGLQGMIELVRYAQEKEEGIHIVAIGGIVPEDLKTLFSIGVGTIAAGGSIRKEESIQVGVDKFLDQL